MKRALALLLTMVLTLGLGLTALAESTAEIAMITDIGTIDDKSFNQGTWEGVVAYAQANGKTSNYYKPAEQSTNAYLDQIDAAVAAGAKVVVTPGYLFEEPIFIAQDKYQDVNFILIDGNPHNADYTEYRTEKNAVGIVFAEEQAGYLAGYAAVKDGYTQLGFMGGMPVPAVVRYGYGFVQGAEAAAKELGLTDIGLKYHYTGDFAATPENQAVAASWYSAGTQVIFACGGAVGSSVMAAAEATENGKVIGVDVDQSSQSERVITSAMKGLAAAVDQALTAYYAGTFPAGEAWVLGADKNGVSLPMATSKFEKFTQADYDALYAKLAAGEVTLIKDVKAEKDADGKQIPNTLADLGTTIVKVEEVK
jgi:basic membrane protein A